MIDRLEEIIRRVTRATPGPWRMYNPQNGRRPAVFVGRAQGVEVPPKFYIAYLPDMTDGDALPDAIFIAAARDDIPWMAGRIRALKEALKLMVDPQPCKYAPNGMRCLTHGESKPCRYEIVREALEE